MFGKAIYKYYVFCAATSYVVVNCPLCVIVFVYNKSKKAICRDRLPHRLMVFLCGSYRNQTSKMLVISVSAHKCVREPVANVKMWVGWGGFFILCETVKKMVNSEIYVERS